MLHALGWLIAAIIVGLLVWTAYRWGRNDGEYEGFRSGFERAIKRNELWEMYVNEQI